MEYMEYKGFVIKKNDYGTYNVIDSGGKSMARNLHSLDRALFAIQRFLHNTRTDKRPMLGAEYDTE